MRLRPCETSCVATSHLVLASTPETVRFGRLPGADARCVGELAPGGVLVVDTVSHEGLLPDQGSDPVTFFTSLGIREDEVLEDVRTLARAGLARDPERDGPHIVTGPVALTGVRAGDLIRIETLGLERRTDYGIVSNRHNKGVLAGEFPLAGPDGPPPVVSHLARVVGPDRGELRDGAGRAIRFALGEFLGLIGVTPDAADEQPSTPPGPYGGNLDIRHLGVGSSLLVRAALDGGLVVVGDPHFAQGNGEVALTAFEAPLRATLRCSVETGASARRVADLLAHPFGETTDAHLAIGLGATLDEALAAATRHAVALVSALTGLAPETALAYLSVTADFEVSQAVNGVRGVHCVVKKRDLASVSP